MEMLKKIQPIFCLIDPNGDLHHVTHIRQFCREHNLNASNISKLGNGSRKTHKGWRLATEPVCVQKTNVQDCLIFYSKVYYDQRGSFTELFQQMDFESKSLPSHDWVQTNCSKSRRGVVRGLHIANFAKLITCLRGIIFDVVADTRKDSPTYGQHTVIRMESPDTHVYVPPGCAHGFMCLDDQCLVVYFQSDVYNPATESSVNWRDPKIGIKWPQGYNYILSPKDAEAPFL